MMAAKTAGLVVKLRRSFSNKKRQGNNEMTMSANSDDEDDTMTASKGNNNNNSFSEFQSPSPNLSTPLLSTPDLRLPEIPLHPLWNGRRSSANSGSFSVSPLIRPRTIAKDAKTRAARKTLPAPKDLPMLRSKLRVALEEFELPLRMSDRDLELLLQDNAYAVPSAVQDFVERAQLRQVDANLTLKMVECDSPGTYNAWSRCDASVFKVRCGPRYRELKMKKPASKDTLYEVFAVDMYLSAPNKQEHLSRYMKLAEMENAKNDQHPLPNVFIANFMLPLNEPKLFAGADNGPTIHFHLVMKLSSWARTNPTHASVKLAARLMSSNVDEHAAMKERLKIIVQIANPDELQLGKVERGLCNKYNSLPFLYRAYNSRYHHGGAWFQADFDGHRSGYATRMARHSLMHLSESIVANVAFLVEGELDEELPEMLLGCATVHRLQCRSAQVFACPAPSYPLLPFAESEQDL